MEVQDIAHMQSKNTENNSEGKNSRSSRVTFSKKEVKTWLQSKEGRLFRAHLKAYKPLLHCKKSYFSFVKSITKY